LPRHVERLAQRELAQLAKRELDYVRAISLWDALRQMPSQSKRHESPLLAEDACKALETAIEAAEQLAIYYEHRAKTPQRALDLMRAAIAELQAACPTGLAAHTDKEKIRAQLNRRLARLERRCGTHPSLNLAKNVG
jgi:hypothetical protein